MVQYSLTGLRTSMSLRKDRTDSQALPFQGESVKDITTRAMAMLLTDIMKGD